MKFVWTIFFASFLAVLAADANGQSIREEATLSTGYDLSQAVKLFPNPAVEYLHVRFDDPIAKQSKLTIHNILGNILDVEREAVDDHEVRLRVKELPTGYYLLAVKEEVSNGRVTLKFLKR